MSTAVKEVGVTVGYYIPTHRPIAQADRQALTEASRQFSELLAAQGLDPEELIRDAFNCVNKTNASVMAKQIVLDANILIRAVLGKRVEPLLHNYADTITFITVEDAETYVPNVIRQRGETR